jgi:hypothetical protein
MRARAGARNWDAEYFFAFTAIVTTALAKMDSGVSSNKLGNSR